MSKKCKGCGGPRFGLSEYCVECRHPGMTRTPDHATSEAAAGKVKRLTIRARVLCYAENTPRGFIDEQLHELSPSSPESSFRKRRSELSDECIILDTGRTRANSHGDQCVIWCHRKFHPNPPPIVVKAKGKAADAIRRSRREKKMYNALVAVAYRYAHTPHSQVVRQVAEALDLDYPIVRGNIPAPLPL